MSAELQTALTVSMRHIDAPTTTEQEREAILSATATVFSGETGELAARTLYHLREGRKMQLTLKAILVGVGAKQ